MTIEQLFAITEKVQNQIGFTYLNSPTYWAHSFIWLALQTVAWYCLDDPQQFEDSFSKVKKHFGDMRDEMQERSKTSRPSRGATAPSSERAGSVR